jgi:hypothetical protein
MLRDIHLGGDGNCCRCDGSNGGPHNDETSRAQVVTGDFPDLRVVLNYKNPPVMQIVTERPNSAVGGGHLLTLGRPGPGRERYSHNG